MSVNIKYDGVVILNVWIVSHLFVLLDSFIKGDNRLCAQKV